MCFKIKTDLMHLNFLYFPAEVSAVFFMGSDTMLLVQNNYFSTSSNTVRWLKLN